MEVPPGDLDKGLGALLAFSEKAKPVTPNDDSRGPIKGRRIEVDDAIVTDDRTTPSAKDHTPEGTIKHSPGKKRRVLLKPL